MKPSGAVNHEVKRYHLSYADPNSIVKWFVKPIFDNL
jgi:hypothetical protein